MNLFGRVRGPKYDGNYLRTVVNELIGDLTLNQTLTNVVIPAFDIKILQPVIFTTNDVIKIFMFQFCVYSYIFLKSRKEIK